MAVSTETDRVSRTMPGLLVLLREPPSNCTADLDNRHLYFTYASRREGSIQDTTGWEDEGTQGVN
jgi:hypothetical protein